MSREIEFRGLNENGDFVYGLYVQNAFDGTSRNVAHGIQSAGCYQVEIDPNTLGQYTGIKDCNGVKIFESDIAEASYDYEPPSTHLVRWGGDEYPAFELSPELGCECNGFSHIKNCSNTTIKVIGNIHQNPELLQVKICEK